jgi:hypothetical protein
MKNILIFGDANKRAAIACIRALACCDVRIHVALRNPSDFRCRLIFKKWMRGRSVLKYSLRSKEDFVKSLVSIRERTGPCCVLPIGHTCVEWLSEEKDFLEGRGIAAHVCPAVIHRRLSGKDKFYDLCVEYEIPYPSLLDLDPAERYSRPFVVKAKGGDGGPGVLQFPLLVEGPGSHAVFHQLHLDYEKHFFQEYVKGDSIYYCAAYSCGRKTGSFVQKNLAQQPDGKSVVKAVPIPPPPGLPLSSVDRMFSELGYDGVMMMEFRHSEETGAFYAIECNARFWGPLQLAVDNGVNFPALLLGLDAPPATQKPCGYLWSGGYFDGLFLKWISRTRFQRGTHEKNLRCRDVWFRRDTLRFALVEPLTILCNRVRQICSARKETAPAPMREKPREGGVALQDGTQ